MAEKQWSEECEWPNDGNCTNPPQVRVHLHDCIGHDIMDVCLAHAQDTRRSAAYWIGY